MKTTLTKSELARLIRKAQELSVSKDLELAAISQIAMSSVPYLRFSNIDKIIVERTPNGRWNADIHIKNVPVGVAKCVGIPSNAPVETKEEALEYLKLLISQMILNERLQETPAPPKTVSFEFDDVVFTISQKAVAQVKSQMNEVIGGKKIEFNMMSLRTLYCQSQRLTKLRYERLSQREKAQIVSACILALASGFNRWPNNDRPSTEILN